MGIIEISEVRAEKLLYLSDCKKKKKKGYGLLSPAVEECHFVKDFNRTAVNILHQDKSRKKIYLDFCLNFTV